MSGREGGRSAGQVGEKGSAPWCLEGKERMSRVGGGGAWLAGLRQDGEDFHRFLDRLLAGLGLLLDEGAVGRLGAVRARDIRYPHPHEEDADCGDAGNQYQ